MNLKQFVAELADRGVKLWVESDQLHIHAPKGVLTPELRDDLALYKAELLLLLQHSNTLAKLTGGIASDHELPLVRVERTRDLPLSSAQERMWFLSQLDPTNPFYNEPHTLRLHGSVNVFALEYSLNKIIQRHEVLRTNFATVNGQQVQVIAESLTLSVPVVDLQYLPESDREIYCQQLATKEVQQPLKLASSALIRATLFKLTEVEYVLLLTIHHIVFDGWSWGIFLRELATFYSAFCNNLSPELPELSIQYADFAVWERQWLQKEVLKSQLAYWKQQLQGAPALLELPTDRARPKTQTFRGATHRVALSLELTRALLSLSQRQGVTLFVLLLAAFQTLLYRYTGQTDICVGTVHANRDHPEIDSLIGFFVNTLVLRTCLSGNPSFEDVLSRAQEIMLLAHAHQNLPFEKLVEELKLERDLSYTPLVQVMLVLNEPMPQIQMAGLTVSWLAVETATAKFDLSLGFENTASGLIGEWEYNTDLFVATTIARMAGHFQTLLEVIVTNPKQRVSELPLLTERERHQLLVEWNNTTKEYTIDKCIHQLFEEQVERSPDAIAVVNEGEQLTYRELNQRANKIAHHLKNLGVGPEVLVGICVLRSPLMVIGLLGILKAGGAYVPLDPAYPSSRLVYMLSDAQVGVLLTQQKLVDSLPSHRGRTICLDSDWHVIEVNSEENLVSEVIPTNLAYIIYTSGSTGEPKGVAIAHQSVVNLIAAMKVVYGTNSSDSILQFSSISFDSAVDEIYICLSCGATLVLRSDEMLSSVRAFLQKCQKWQLTVLPLPTTYWHQLTSELATTGESLPESVRLVTIGGEAVQREKLRLWQEYVQPNRQSHQWEKPLLKLINGYGPTEATVEATVCNFSELVLKDTRSQLPIGRPIGNVQAYILDRYLQPVPIGIPGELYLGGVGLARGYLNRPDLTAQKFIPHPFNESGRLYKTGDQACYLRDGNITFLGRIDNQVKVRGFRIELGEIETLLATHPQVSEAVVIVREDIEGNKRLVAYVVAHAQSSIKNQLRDFLKQKLPDYMVPSVFVILDALPLTPNDKVDHRALPEPNTQLSDSTSFVPPRDTVEQQLQLIWSEVLQLTSVGVQDNFFTLGGHSLLAVRLMALIERHFGLNLPLATLFLCPTIEQLASHLRQLPDSLPWSSLVAIQSSGDKRPFFCVPGVGGNVIYLYELARHLGADQPFYGLQAKGLDGESEPFTKVEDIANHYIEAIQTVQPTGPYLLGGHSFGGVVAFEMAQQLRKMGHEVALLAIIDAVAPILSQKPNCIDEDDTAYLTDFASYIGYMLSRDLEVSLETLASLTFEEQLHYLKERLSRVNLLPEDAGIRSVRGGVQVYKANWQAHGGYLPLIVKLPAIALFGAQEVNAVEDAPLELTQMLKEPTLGWNEFSTTIDIHVVTGNHMTMMAPPHVQELAAQLRASLEQAQAHSAGACTR